MTTARELTPELYTELIEELTHLAADGNPWARSWVQILTTVPEDDGGRRAVLAALIRGLPALYFDFERLGYAIAAGIASSEDYELEDLEAVTAKPSRPPSVPDSLGALFEPLARPKAGEEEE